MHLKVVATVNGKKEKIFGWHTPAVGEYTKFLESFLPQLTAKLRKWEIADVTYFHISDEPRERTFESYKAAKESLKYAWTGFHTFDALSVTEFYRSRSNGQAGSGKIMKLKSFCKWSDGYGGLIIVQGQFYEVSN